MGKLLTSGMLAQFDRDGIIFPMEAMSAAEAASLRRQVEALAKGCPTVPPAINERPHILFPWLNELIRHPRLLDAVEDILGPDLLCWYSGFFMKRPGDGSFVSWHQDSTYWGLSAPDVVTAWVALTPSDRTNGCLQVVPGTHLSQIAHTETFGAGNLLSRGQEITAEVDEADVVDVILAAGQFSIHHVQIVHGSQPNWSDSPRIGFAIRYIPTHVRQTSVAIDSATLVRGEDKYGHFMPEPIPVIDHDPEGARFIAAMLEHWG